MHSLPGSTASIDPFLLDLPDGDEMARRGAVYSRLVQALRPGSIYETLRVQEMAVALMEINDLRGRVDTLRKFLRDHAAERFEAATRKHYELLDRDLLKSRGANRSALAAHMFGASLLAKQWEAFRSRLEEGGWVDHLAICKVLVSEGFSDRIENLEGKPFWIVARILKLFKDPGPIMMDWVKHCRIRDAEAQPYFIRVMTEVSKVESAETAIQDLEALCDKQIQYWSDRAGRLRADHERQKEEFCAGFSAYPGIASSIRTLISLQKMQFARIARLEKELRALKREAEKDAERRQLHAARLEAIRNGTLPPRSKRKPASDPLETPVLTPDYVLATQEVDSQDFPADSEMISVPDHEIVSNPDPVQDEHFPEWALVEAVQESDHSFTQSMDGQSEDQVQTEKAVAEHSSLEPVDSRHAREIKKIISEMSPLELASPHRHERFSQIYHRSGRSRRRAMQRLVTQEQVSRGLTRNFVPSG